MLFYCYKNRKGSNNFFWKKIFSGNFAKNKKNGFGKEYYYTKMNISRTNEGNYEDGICFFYKKNYF